MDKIRLFVIIFSAAIGMGAGLLNNFKLGDTLLSTGYETHFRSTPIPSEHRIIFRTDPQGDISCWFQFKLPRSSAKITAQTSTGLSLSVINDRRDPRFDWVSVTSGQISSGKKFSWPSGESVVVSFAGEAKDLSVADWQIFLSDRPSDSRARSIRRVVILIVSILACVIAVAGVVFETRHRLVNGPTILSAEDLLRLVIGTIATDDSAETQRIQVFLIKKIIERMDEHDILNMWNLKSMQKRQIAFKARKLLKQRLEVYIEQLSLFYNRLNTFERKPNE